MWDWVIRLRNFLNNLSCRSKCSNCCDNEIVIVGKDYNDNYLPKK